MLEHTDPDGTDETTAVFTEEASSPIVPRAKSSHSTSNESTRPLEIELTGWLEMKPNTSKVFAKHWFALQGKKAFYFADEVL